MNNKQIEIKSKEDLKKVIKSNEILPDVNIRGNEIEVFEGYLTNLNYSKEYNISFLPSEAYFIKLEYDGIVLNKQFIKE